MIRAKYAAFRAKSLTVLRRLYWVPVPFETAALWLAFRFLTPFRLTWRDAWDVAAQGVLTKVDGK